MAKQNTRHRWPWTTDEVKQLKVLLKQNTPTPILALKLKRTERSIRSKVQKLNLSLKPTNRSPYG
jgi:transcriptional antiterminator